jgi:hypothetical protein
MKGPGDTRDRGGLATRLEVWGFQVGASVAEDLRPGPHTARAAAFCPFQTRRQQP